MAAPLGRTGSPLEKLLFEAGPRFEFFQAVRLLEQFYAGRQPVGSASEPAREVVRFKTRVSLSFPPSEIYEIARRFETDPQDDGPAQMIVAFMGLTGPAGILPRHYTQLLLERIREKDFALWEFLDLFHHRLIALFYRAWKKYRVYLLPASPQQPEPCANYLLALMGLGTPGLQNLQKFEDRALLFYAGLLAQHPRSASALETLLQDFFEAPVQVSQFAGQWLKVDAGEVSFLSAHEMNNQLGCSAILGDAVWDQQSKFRLTIGPLCYDSFYALLPEGKTFQCLMQLVRFFAGQEHDFEVQLVLRAAEVPRLQFGEKDIATPRLGWNTWLKTKEFRYDATDAVIACDGISK